jgi:hypothetical protein
MDRIVYKNPGGPDVICEIEFEAGTYLYKYSLEVRVKMDNNDVIYRTAGTVNSYEAAVAVTEGLSKSIYALATSGENHAER